MRQRQIQIRTIQGDLVPVRGMARGQLVVSIDRTGEPPPKFSLAKAVEEAEAYLAKHPEDAGIVNRSLDAITAKIASAATAIAAVAARERQP